MEGKNTWVIPMSLNGLEPSAHVVNVPSGLILDPAGGCQCIVQVLIRCSQGNVSQVPSCFDLIGLPGVVHHGFFSFFSLALHTVMFP